MKKGFTLVELLGVITVLGIIAVITVPLVTSTIKDSKDKAYEKQVDVIESAAKQWGLENIDSLPTDNTKEYVSLDTLINSGKIQNTSIINPKTNEEMTGCIVITYNSEYNQYEYKYENESACNFLPTPKSFAKDSWETIVANVKAGNLSAYNVGDTKEIKLNGFTNGEEKSNGLYTIRIANTSTDDPVCSTSGYSQTACGFVIEFVDIITNHNMNPSGTYKGVSYSYGWNKDGWPASSMKKYIDETIYNALPQELRDNIIETQVVSSYGSSDSTNFTSKDKLYLLSTKEVFGKKGTTNKVSYDTAEAETRQLDYYNNIGVTTSNYSGAKKQYNGSNALWWLRSAHSYYIHIFYYVSASGDWYNYSANTANGVSPAFRIG